MTIHCPPYPDSLVKTVYYNLYFKVCLNLRVNPTFFVERWGKKSARRKKRRALRTALSAPFAQEGGDIQIVIRRMDDQTPGGGFFVPNVEGRFSPLFLFLIETGGNHRHDDLILEIFIDHRSENHVHFRIG